MDDARHPASAHRDHHAPGAPSAAAPAETRHEARVRAARAHNREAAGCPADPAVAWAEVVAASGLDPAALAPFAGTLVHAYTRHPRAYHDLSHLHEVMRHAAAAPVRDRTSVSLALLFHDVVYRRASGDEAESAKLASALLEGGPFARMRDRVAEMIRATCHGDADHRDDPDLATMLDCDLAVLGAEPSRFDAYDDAIAAEYGDRSARLYRYGRRRCLAQLLARPRIYQSAHFAAAHEAQARANLRRAIERLEGAGAAPWWRRFG